MTEQEMQERIWAIAEEAQKPKPMPLSPAEQAQRNRENEAVRAARQAQEDAEDKVRSAAHARAEKQKQDTYRSEIKARFKAGWLGDADSFERAFPALFDDHLMQEAKVGEKRRLDEMRLGWDLSAGAITGSQAMSRASGTQRLR